jgi:hypothetical protein
MISTSPRLIVSVIVAVLLLAPVAAQEGSVQLSVLSTWNIVIPPGHAPAVRYAAEELRTVFHRASGDKLDIVTETARPGRHIFIGNGQAMRNSSAALAVDDLGDEDLRIQVRSDNIALVGGSPRGTLYAVYTFCEDYLGVRFLSPQHTHVPPLRRGSVLPVGTKEYRPPLRFRYCYYGPNHLNHEHAVRLRNNAITDDSRLGGRTDWRLINHTLSGMVPWRRYGGDHPEYFAEIDGERPEGLERHQTYEFQICPSHPEVIRIVTEAVLKRLEKDPARRNISVSQADNRNYCRCETCRTINEHEGSPMGAHLRMINKVADAVKKQYPDIMVGTLAYQYTREAPEHTKPRDNVMIQLCSIECCQLHSIDDPDCAQNRAFCEDMAEWGAICEEIHVWHYNVNFLDYLSPVPNLHTIQPNVRYFAENNAQGLFMQAAGGARGASLANLRNYIICNLMWDPTRDGRALREEFIRLHYGEAADPIRRYIDLLHANAQKREIHHHCFGTARDYGVDEAIMRRGLALLEEALQKAKTDEVRRRVEKASIAMHRVAIEPVVAWIKEQLPARGMRQEEDAVETLRDVDMPADLAKNMRPRVAKFLALCQRHNVNKMNERVSVESADLILRAAFGVPDGEEW